ncbi:TetR/AcrR family transcriptional regulator [Rhizobium leguminosarum]
MDKIIRKRRGGPRKFDRDEAVHTAMRLFWRHGYEGVSLNDLTAAIGVAPPSLYAAFGSKAGLYRETLDRYFGMPGALTNLGATCDLPQTVDLMLLKAIDAVTSSDGERGCMVSSGMLQTAPEHAKLAEELAERRSAMRATIATILLPWLSQDRAESLAQYLVTVLQGLSVQARDGASPEQLRDVVAQVVAGIRATATPGPGQPDRKGDDLKASRSVNQTG